jgi:hypothetical protein
MQELLAQRAVVVCTASRTAHHQQGLTAAAHVACVYMNA